MSLTKTTRDELKQARHIYFESRYVSFLIKWIAFNRAYNELFIDIRYDEEKVMMFGAQMQDHFSEVRNLADQLVSLECIGGKRSRDSSLLSPTKKVKWATLLLRNSLGLDSRQAGDCDFVACRRQKRTLCNSIPIERQPDGEVSALLRLVYQVRCNIFHGDKRLFGDIQTDRDKELVDLSEKVLDICIDWLLKDSSPIQVENHI